jgi:hypothetical protein
MAEGSLIRRDKIQMHLTGVPVIPNRSVNASAFLCMHMGSLLGLRKESCPNMSTSHSIRPLGYGDSDQIDPGSSHVALSEMSFKIRRTYEKPARNDGCRVLVDRIWPRCLKGRQRSISGAKRSRRARHCESDLRMTPRDGWSSNVVTSRNSMCSMSCANS